MDLPCDEAHLRKVREDQLLAFLIPGTVGRT
jgi:hypothetical protein